MTSLPPPRRTTHEPTMMAMSMPNPILEDAEDEAKDERGADDETNTKRFLPTYLCKSPPPRDLQDPGWKQTRKLKQNKKCL